MVLLGNVIWFVLGGWLLFFVYLLGAVVFFPVFIPLFRLAKYSAWPFGRTVLTQGELSSYRAASNIQDDTTKLIKGLRMTSGVLNFVWLLTFGWVLALLHLIACLINLACFWLVVTIPNIGGHWKMIGVALMPFNKVIVSSNLAQEIKDTNTRKKHNL